MQTQEIIAETLQSFIESITESNLLAMEETNGVEPMLVFIYEKQDGRFDKAELFVGKLIDSQMGKDVLAQTLIPMCKKKITDDGNIIHSVAFIHEAWAYEMPKGYVPKENDDYRKIGIKTEKFMMSFHLKDSHLNFVYDMVRDENGKVTLTNKVVQQEKYDDKRVGRFSKLM